MNFAMIFYLLGRVIQVVGAMMAAPCVVALIYRERSGIFFLFCGIAMFAVGTLFTIRLKNPQIKNSIHVKVS